MLRIFACFSNPAPARSATSVPQSLQPHHTPQPEEQDGISSVCEETSIQTSRVCAGSYGTTKSPAVSRPAGVVARTSKTRFVSPFSARLSPSASALSEPNSSADSLTRSNSISKDSSIFSVPAPSSNVFELAGKSSSGIRSSILRPIPVKAGTTAQQPQPGPQHLSLSRVPSSLSLTTAKSSQDLTSSSLASKSSFRAGRLAPGTLASVASRLSSQSETCHSVCSSTASSSLLSASTVRLDIVNPRSESVTNKNSVTRSTSAPSITRGASAPTPSVSLAPDPSEAVRESEEVARQFADAFLRALLSGDKKWGSDPALSALLHENARMITHDQQLFSGKTAIIRRLNQGMEQFLRLVGQEENKTASDTVAAATVAALRAQASGISHTLSIQTQDPSDKLSGSLGSSNSLTRVSEMFSSVAAALMPGQAWRSAASAGASAKPPLGGGGSRVVVATYTFRMGMRRFKLQDYFTIRDGCIRRLRRSRG